MNEDKKFIGDEFEEITDEGEEDLDKLFDLIYHQVYLTKLSWRQLTN